MIGYRKAHHKKLQTDNYSLEQPWGQIREMLDMVVRCNKDCFISEETFTEAKIWAHEMACIENCVMREMKQ